MSLFIVNSNLVSSQKIHLIRLPVQISRHLKQVMFHPGMYIYRYQNVCIGGWLFKAKGNVCIYSSLSILVIKSTKTFNSVSETPTKSVFNSYRNRNSLVQSRSDSDVYAA